MTRKNAKLAPVIFTANGLDTDRPLSEVVEKPIRNHDDNGRFIAGNNLGQGRPRGSRNILSEDFIEDFRTVWAESGIGAIRTMAADDPVAFVKTAASLLPKDFALSLDDDLPMINKVVFEFHRPNGETGQIDSGRTIDQRTGAVARTAGEQR